MGCGCTLCDVKNGVEDYWLVVCEFDPKGNVIGKFGENVVVANATILGNGVGRMSTDKTRPNAGAIGEAKNGGTVDRVQVWCVFVVVWLVIAVVFSY